MDRAKFFASIRANLYGGRLLKDQVSGISAVLDAWDESKQLDHRWLAYMLATAHHETGGKWVASIENLNYSVAGLLQTFSRARISTADANRLGRSGSRSADQVGIANVIYGGKWGEDNLGNTQPGDGWRFRGRGLVQITGRNNYGKYGLEDTPDKAAELQTAVHIMVDGMINGRFTGKKLADYFTVSKADWTNARRIINGLDKAETIAGYARTFDAALRAADA